ncbi:hypothetical protein P886_1639 [Alteromonadaceae bacterium 2753L.S.0a.02]|nr:hypothetical protein P886_1639 [Alteromonadaceae bacterium 2753L.S.0a.02]
MRLKQQDLWVVLAAIGVVITSVFTTVYISQNLHSGGGIFSSKTDGYQNITFTDAVLTCEKYTRSEFGKRLNTLEVDNHSSRYDNKQFLYKIFLQVTTTPRTETTGEHFVNCFVKSSNGRIDKFETWEQKIHSTAPESPGGTNVFGWPK